LKAIGISGTPGVGKSTVAELVSKKLGIPRVDLSRVVIERRLYTEFDEVRGSYVIDEDAVRKYLRDLYSSIGPFVLDSHYAEVAPREILEIVVVIRLDPMKLIDRLVARGWPMRKIAENVEAELLSVPTLNAVEELGEELVLEIDSTGKNAEIVASEALSVIFGDLPIELGHRIDWLSQLPPERLERVLRFIETHRG